MTCRDRKWMFVSINYDLSRFHQMHENDYTRALLEVRNGRKYSHWMWYIFPQLKGLGKSYMSEYYGIADIGEAGAYLADPVLGAHMKELCEALLMLDTDDAVEVFGRPDDKKLRSSMTLFSFAAQDRTVFEAVLSKFFGGKYCGRTLTILDRQIEESFRMRRNKRLGNLSRFEQDMLLFTDPEKDEE